MEMGHNGNGDRSHSGWDIMGMDSMTGDRTQWDWDGTQ